MVKEDRFFYPDIETIYGQIHEGEIVKLVEMAIDEIESQNYSGSCFTLTNLSKAASFFIKLGIYLFSSRLLLKAQFYHNLYFRKCPIILIRRRKRKECIMM